MYVWLLGKDTDGDDVADVDDVVSNSDCDVGVGEKWLKNNYYGESPLVTMMFCVMVMMMWGMMGIILVMMMMMMMMICCTTKSQTNNNQRWI